MTEIRKIKSPSSQAAWTEATINWLTRLAGPGPDHDLSRIEAALLKSIKQGRARLNGTPALTAVFWAIDRLLPTVGAECPEATRLRDLFSAYHQISLYTFQALHSDDTLMADLLDEDSRAAETIPTEIFLKWMSSDCADPTTVAASDLTERRRAAGRRALPPLARTDYDRIDAIVSKTFHGDLMALHQALDDDLLAQRNP